MVLARSRRGDFLARWSRLADRSEGGSWVWLEFVRDCMLGVLVGSGPR